MKQRITEWTLHAMAWATFSFVVVHTFGLHKPFLP
jgi:hypothetical protein